MTDAALYLGLISGTSVDGVDAALVQFEPSTCVLAARTFAYPEALRQQIIALGRRGADMALESFGRLDVHIGMCFADAACALLQQTDTPTRAVRAIGSHGQTVCHRPESSPPFSLQIGDPAVIAERTGIDVVADFRRADVAAGGQGAPLLPIFHAASFGTDDVSRVILNLGGIANITVLTPGRDVLGFDTGPANCLLDAWAQQHLGRDHDEAGAWAATGVVDPDLLQRCLDDPYFAAAPPKSSGREYFDLNWLDSYVPGDLSPADVQATLIALTARSVAAALAVHGRGGTDMLVCGGGVHNPVLMSALTAAVQPITVRSTAALGVDPDFVEASAFAWLARERLARRPGNLPSVTGARGPRVLGVVAAAPENPG